MKSSLYVLKRSILVAVCDNLNIQEKNNEGYFPIGFFVEVKLSVKLFNWVIFKWLSKNQYQSYYSDHGQSAAKIARTRCDWIYLPLVKKLARYFLANH